MVTISTDYCRASKGRASCTFLTASRLPSDAIAARSNEVGSLAAGTTSTGRPQRETTDWAIGNGWAT